MSQLLSKRAIIGIARETFDVKNYTLDELFLLIQEGDLSKELREAIIIHLMHTTVKVPTVLWPTPDKNDTNKAFRGMMLGDWGIATEGEVMPVTATQMVGIKGATV